MIQSAGLEHRVRQEIEIHSRLKHPSILELYSFFQDANYVYLVLELASNGELQRYIKQTLRRPMTESEAANVLREVVNGLLYLHSHHIMHRDISLSNLLLSWDMHVKIADFGLATQLKRPDERHVTMCGTPNYISPEVVNRTSHGLPADVWGLGCMFYTLLVGQPPFDTETVQRTLDKVITSDYYIPPHLPMDAINLIDQLLKKNPKDRIKLEEVLNHSFMIRHSRPPFTATNFTTNSAITTSSGSNSSDFNTYNYNEKANCDSGIITYSSNNSAFKNNLTRPFTMENMNDPHNYNHRVYNHQSSSNNTFSQKSMNSGSAKYMKDDYRNDVDKENIIRNNCSPYQYPSKNDFQDAGIFSTLSSNESNTNKWMQTNPTAPIISTFSSTEIVKSDGSGGDRQAVLSVDPLNTSRLLPTRYKTKNAIMSILKDGNVLIEFIKFKAKYNEDRITDLCWISSNGQRILIHQPEHGRTIPIKDEAPTELLMVSTNLNFSYNTLPEKYWKKYMYAARFINLVKSKTPKVTYYSNLAKCALMESMEDFEVCFYDGSKVVKAPNDVIKVYDRYGRQILDTKTEEIKMNKQSLLDHSDVCWRHCLNICKALELVEQSGVQTCFPVVIGRRRNIDINLYDKLPSSPGIPNSLISTSTPKSFTNPSSLYNNQSEKKALMTAAQSNVPIKRIHLQNIGVATEVLFEFHIRGKFD